MLPADPIATPKAASLVSHRRYRRDAVDRAVRRRGAVPRGLIGAIVVVALVEASILRHGEVLFDNLAFGCLFAGPATTAEAPACDVLYLGDSLAKHALIPRLIEEGSGRRGYNLAVASAPSPATFFLFRRALDAGARPSAIVFDMVPHLLAGGPRYWNRQWPVLLSPLETWELIRSTRGTAFAAELLLFEALPSLRARYDLRAALFNALQGEPLASRALNAVHRRNWTLNEGANVAIKHPSFRGEVTDGDHQKIMSHRFGLHRVNAEYAKRTLALARKRGVTAYLLLPPLPPKVIQRRIATGAEGQYLEFLYRLQSEYPELVVLDARSAGYPASVFVDSLHLDRDGAALLSRDLGTVLRTDLGRPAPNAKRWVAMPAYRDTPGGASQGLEDVEESKERLKAQRQGRL